MKGLARLFLLAVFIGTMGASSCNDKKIELTLFHTNDIHSHMTPPKTEPFGLGGLARMKTLLTQLRTQYPTQLTIDAGDWSEGTWYYSVDEGANMLKALDMMGFDATCVGNHDFLNGPDQLIQSIQQANPSFKVLAANLDASNYSSGPTLAQEVPPSTILQVGGLKVGLIGLTTFDVTFSAYMMPVVITDPVKTATALAEQLRPQVDVLLLISHNTFSYNQQIAAQVPGIDGVISGHSHLKTPTAVLVQNAGKGVPVVETGEWGEFVGDLKLIVDTTVHSVQFESYQLHPVTGVADDATMDSFVAAQDTALATKFNNGVSVNDPILEADFDILQNNTSETALGNLAVKAYRAETAADLSLEEMSFTTVGLVQGGVSLADIHNIVPHIYNPATNKEWTVHIWNALGSDLATIIQAFYSGNAFGALTGGLVWLSADNADIIWTPGDGIHSLPAVKSINIGGNAINPGARYRVAIVDGLLQGIETANSLLHLGLDLSSIQDTGIEASKAILDYGLNAKQLTATDLAIGNHVKTESPDLALYNYNVTYDGNNISVIVQNQGLADAGQSVLSCYSGLVNDSVSYNTALEKWTLIGTATVPAIASMGQATAQIAWSSSGLTAGIWPIYCEVDLAADTFTTNNTVYLMETIGAN